MAAEKAKVIAQTNVQAIAQRGVAARASRLLHGVTVPVNRATFKRKHSSGQATTFPSLDRAWIEQP